MNKENWDRWIIKISLVFMCLTCLGNLSQILYIYFVHFCFSFLISFLLLTFHWQARTNDTHPICTSFFFFKLFAVLPPLRSRIKSLIKFVPRPTKKKRIEATNYWITGRKRTFDKEKWHFWMNCLYDFHSFLIIWIN